LIATRICAGRAPESTDEGRSYRDHQTGTVARRDRADRFLLARAVEEIALVTKAEILRPCS